MTKLLCTLTALLLACVLSAAAADIQATAPDNPAVATTTTITIADAKAPRTPEPTQLRLQRTYLGVYRVTAYCPCETCCGEWADGITATGTTAQQGITIAVDPQIIPYGTRVTIDGHTYTAQDCGGAIKGKRIDVFFDRHEDAQAFGVQYHKIYVGG